MTSTSEASASGGLCPGGKGVSSVENLEKFGWVLFGLGVSVATVSAVVIVVALATVVRENATRSGRAYALFLYIVAVALIAVMIQVMREVYKGYVASGKSDSDVSLSECREVSEDGPALSNEREVSHYGVGTAQGMIQMEGSGEREGCSPFEEQQHDDDCISCGPGNASDLLSSRRLNLPYACSEVVNNAGKADGHERKASNSSGRKGNSEKLCSSVAVGTSDIIEFKSFSDDKVIYGVDSNSVQDCSWVNGVWKSFREGQVFVRGIGTGKNRTVALQIGDLQFGWPNFEVFAHKGSEILWKDLKYDINLVCDLKFAAGYELLHDGALLAIPEESGDGVCESGGEIFYKVRVHSTYNNLVGLMFSYENVTSSVGESLFLRYLGMYWDFFDMSMLVRSDIKEDGYVTLRIQNDLFFGSRMGRQLATDMVRYRDGFLRAMGMYCRSERYLAALCCFFERVGKMIPECFHVHDNDMRSGTLFDAMSSIYALTCGRSSGYFMKPTPATKQALYYAFFSSSTLRAACIFQEISSKLDNLRKHEQSYFTSCIQGLDESIDALLRLFSNIHCSDASDKIEQMYNSGSGIEKTVLWAVLLSSLKFSYVVESVLKKKEGSLYGEMLRKHRYLRLLSNDPSEFCGMSLDAADVERTNDMLSSLVPYAAAETLVAFLEGSKGESILKQISGEYVKSGSNEQDCSSPRDLSDWAVVNFITRGFQSNNFGGLLSTSFVAHVLPLSGSSNFCGIVLPVCSQKKISGHNGDCTTKGTEGACEQSSYDSCKAMDKVGTSLQNLSVSAPQVEEVASAVCL